MNKTRLKVGTDFSGIGAPEMALNNLGIDYEQVFSCEIDKYARDSYDAIHKAPGKFYIDITKRNHKDVEQLDLYVAGFPCQAFSNNGHRKGFDDVRGTLFFDVADFIRINQPKMFILENVKGLLTHDNGKTYQTITDILTNCGGTLNGQMSLDVFDDGLGYHVYAQVLNTKDYGIPQNRERIFIVGFKDFRSFSFPKTEPLRLRLKDVLQNECDEKYHLSESTIQKLVLESDDGQGKMKIKTATLSGYEVAEQGDSINYTYADSKTRRGRVGKGVAQTLDTGCTQAIVQPQVKQINMSKESGNIQPHQQNRVYDKEGLSPALNTIWNGGNIVNTKKIRRLTPLECFRLQAFPDEQFYKAQKVCSDTQLYKQSGNSITVVVLERIFQKMFNLTENK